MGENCSDPFAMCEERREIGGKTFVVAAGADYTGRIDCPEEAWAMYADGLITEGERDYMIALLTHPAGQE